MKFLRGPPPAGGVNRRNLREQLCTWPRGLRTSLPVLRFVSMAVMRSDDIPNVTQAETDLEVRCGERNAESHNASSSASRFSKSVRSGAPPVVSVDVQRQIRIILPT